jgi:dihydropteroate synthase
MGILNITPDSFYDGGRFTDNDAILQQVQKMLDEGASIIDVGGMSSRPGAENIPLKEELDRVLPVIELLKKNFGDILISIDTVKAEVARQAIATGASLVNDISAGTMDETMYPTVAELGVPYVLMHMQGRPENMQQKPSYEAIIEEVLDFFIAQIGQLRALGVKDIILDPGFGFGKTMEHNYTLLKKMHVFQMLNLPILAGLSRKSMIYKKLKTTPDLALNGTSVLNLVALQQGARILRVHDVKEAREVIQLWTQLENS